ncbi:hypothetical protein P4S64_13590 [Vibrio sp. M60_M31a]
MKWSRASASDTLADMRCSTRSPLLHARRITGGGNGEEKSNKGATRVLSLSCRQELKLRWLHETEKGTKRPYRLQIRTNTSYGDNRYIRYHITKLWDDDYMTNCEIVQEDKQA